MAKVIVHYGHPLTQITGKSKEEVITESGSSVLDLLKVLAAKYGDSFKEYVFLDFEKKELNKNIIISLNAKNVSDTIKKTKIKSNDFLTIFPPVGGG